MLVSSEDKGVGISIFFVDADIDNLIADFK